MENKTKQETEHWVEERMALLDAPNDWEPDVSVAHTRLQGRLSARRSSRAWIWLPRAAVVALACVVLLFAIPTTRALTQQLWQWLTVRKVEVVQADFERLRGPWLIPQAVFIEEEELLEHTDLPTPSEDRPGPDQDQIELRGPNQDLNPPEAAKRAGFWPRLPHDGVPRGWPMLMTLDPIVWSTTLKTDDLELSLRQAGVDDQPIPKEWDGAQVSLHVGSAITAAWPGASDGEEGSMSLMQHQPITLSAPPGFDFVTYWTAALRASGVNRDKAEQLAERMATAPTMLLGIVAKHEVAIRDINLLTGPATLIEHIGKTGKVERVTLIWSVADRVYHLDGTSEEQAIRAANSIE